MLKLSDLLINEPCCAYFRLMCQVFMINSIQVWQCYSAPAPFSKQLCFRASLHFTFVHACDTEYKWIPQSNLRSS